MKETTKKAINIEKVEPASVSTEKQVNLKVPKIPEEIYVALFGSKSGVVTQIEQGIHPGYTIFKKGEEIQ